MRKVEVRIDRFCWAFCAVFLLLVSAVSSFGATYYVSASRPDDTGDGTSWATAKRTIQAAVDRARANGDSIIVTNGTYNEGFRVTPGYSCTNRVCITNAISIQSVNGPDVTIIDGSGSMRGVFMNNGCSLTGFTITNGQTMTKGHSGFDRSGGGACGGTLYNCTLSGNSAGYGGGAYGGMLYNCILFGNSASSDGGGVCDGTLNNCTLSGNSADDGGGAYNGTLYNCIVWGNKANTDPNYNKGTLRYCCTTPLPDGEGNIDNDPRLVDAAHIAADSPCRGAGSSDYSTGVDIDGDAWDNPPSIGCDEFVAASATGGLAVSVQSVYPQVAIDFSVDITATITGHALSNRWTFGDGTVMTNRLEATHAWGAAGTYEIIVTVWNEDCIAGVSATQTIDVASLEDSTQYVWTNSPSPAAPYATWQTAAHTIQDAVDVAVSIPGALIWVTNGHYASGGKVTPGFSCTNRVCITNTISIQSVNGPDVTIIDGSGSMRGVFMTNGCYLTGFTITNGQTMTGWRYDTVDTSSGGILAWTTNCVVSNCTLSGNSAHDGGGATGGTLNNCTLTGNSAEMSGGGAIGGTLNNCMLSGNSAGAYGGGAFYGTLNNCTLSGNSAGMGGGAGYGTLYNCTLTRNSASHYGGGGSYWSTLYNCTLSGNSADDGDGGGANNCTLNNCTLSGNSAEGYGGGAAGGTLTNCTLTGNSAEMNGGGSYGGTLNNCTLTGNSVEMNGGGSYGSTLYNCILSGNSANCGGGADYGTLNSCTLTGNSAEMNGGGANNCTLDNCTLTGNSADPGGGAYGGKLYNCIVWGNTNNDIYLSDVHYTCASDGITNGMNGCITSNPLFVDAASSNVQLQADSPCINAGDNAYVMTYTDLAGNPRISAKIVDMGAYEVQFIKATQAITFADIAPRVYGASAFDAGATASSGLPVSYALSDAGVATNVGSMIYIVGAGTCDVTASQAGNDEYAAAVDVVHTLTVSQKAVTVTGAVAQNKEYDGTTAATITGGALSGVVGADDVSLANAATGTFASASIGTNIAVQSYMTLSGADSANYTLSQPTLAADITRKTQAITFTQIPQQIVTNTVTLEATTDSSLPLTFAVASGSAQINGSNVVFSYAGDVSVTCSQEGDASWQPATVTNTFTVLPLMPAVVTHDASKVDNFSFTAGGEVTSDGQGLTSRGICWATNTVPTVNDFKTVNGSGTGVYVSVAGSLQRNTKYYFRAYANNASGVVYGDEMMVTTSNQASSLDFLLLLLRE